MRKSVLLFSAVRCQAEEVLRKAREIVVRYFNGCQRLMFPIRDKFEGTRGYRILLRQVESWLRGEGLPQYKDIWWFGYGVNVSAITNMVISGVYDILCPVPFIPVIASEGDMWMQQKWQFMSRAEKEILKFDSSLRAMWSWRLHQLVKPPSVL